MKILIAGASGFIGRNLVNILKKEHQITVLGREQAILSHYFDEDIKLCTWQSLSNLDANDYQVIINLCGSNIGASRWTSKIKQQLINSRVNTTANLIDWAIKHGAKPHIYCANAIGIYGIQDNNDAKAFDESSIIDFNHPHDFLSEIGIRWQQALQPAIDNGMPVTITRFGVVLKKREGMLKKIAPSFYFGFGSILGEGKQVISWIHIDDLISAFCFLLNHPELTGAFNLTSPYPISQAEFARTFAKVLHRPFWLKTPAFVIRFVFGEMGESLLLSGQRVLPKRLVEVGFSFKYPEIEQALSHEYKI